MLGLLGGGGGGGRWTCDKSSSSLWCVIQYMEWVLHGDCGGWEKAGVAFTLVVSDCELVVLSS